MSKRWSRKWRWTARIIAIGGSAIALWLVLRRLDLVALGATFRTMRLRWYLAAHVAFALGLLGSAIRWHLMLRLNRKAVVHGAASVRMVFISQFFNTFFGGPSGGDIPKTALYSRWFGVPAADVLAASVLDRLVSTTGGMIFAVFAVAAGVASGAFDFVVGWEWHSPDPGVTAVVVLVLLLIVAIGLWMWRRPESFLGRAFRSLQFSIRRLVSSSRRSGHALLCGVCTAILFNIAQVFCLQAVCDQPVPWFKLFWLYHVVTAAAALPITIAGTGVREAVAMLLLPQYGISPTTAVVGAMLTLSVQVIWALVGASLLVTEQRIRRRRTRPAPPKTISAVVPTLNEKEELPETLSRLRAIPEISEVIVSDGGSSDGTPEIATQMGCRVVFGPRGRGEQLATGASVSQGDILLFVHADTWLSPEAGQAIFRCLRDPLVVGGGFWKRFRNPSLPMRGSRLRCWLRLWWAGRVLGDQALFVRRAALETSGGVPRQPLMEEVEICRRLRRLGRLALAGAAVSTSARRFTERGVFRTYWLMWHVWRAYRRGVPPEELARLYNGKQGAKRTEPNPNGQPSHPGGSRDPG